MQNFIPLKKETPAVLDDIDLGYQATIIDHTRQMADEESQKPGQMLPQKVLQERFQKELMKEFHAFRNQLKNGASKIVESLKELSVQNRALFAQDVVDAFDHIAGLSKVIKEDEKAFNEKISHGISLQELAQISDETIDKLYQGAKNLYENARYEDAGDAFLFLSNINPNKHAFWLGLANSRYCLKGYDEAIKAYINACDTNSMDPSAYLYLSRCYTERGERDLAINSLDKALQIVKENKDSNNWKSILEQEKIRVAARLHH